MGWTWHVPDDLPGNPGASLSSSSTADGKIDAFKAITASRKKREIRATSSDSASRKTY